MSAYDPHDLSLGAGLLLGAYLVAQDITHREPEGEAHLRMESALGYLASDLRQEAAEFFVTGEPPELASITHGLDRDDRVRFLVELEAGSPFYPFQFQISKRREVERRAALRQIAHASLGLDRGEADKVISARREAFAAQKKHGRAREAWEKVSEPKNLLRSAVMGAAGVGVALAAAPAIAVLMPAAAGLSGAAAVSAGLAQLGFGSIAAGGLGMAGGMWVLGAGGAAVGAVSLTTATLLSQPGSAGAVGTEVWKLLTTFVLADDAVIQTPPDEFAKALDKLVDDIGAVITLEESRNEEGSARLKELYELRRVVAFAGEFMTSRPKPAAD